MAVRHLKRGLRSLLVVMGLTVLAACGSQDAVSTDAGAPTSQPPAFLATWVPPGLDHGNASIAPQFITWGDAGRKTSIKAESYVFAGNGAHGRAHMSVTAVTAQAFPAGFWEGFNTSASYEHKQLGEFDTAMGDGSGANSTVAIGYGRGYILQVVANGVPREEVEQFVSGLKWRQGATS